MGGDGDAMVTTGGRRCTSETGRPHSRAIPTLPCRTRFSPRNRCKPEAVGLFEPVLLTDRLRLLRTELPEAASGDVRVDVPPAASLTRREDRDGACPRPSVTARKPPHESAPHQAL